ncbi:MAG: cbb3-type cytochrome c oxidase subunit I, partial [Thermoguttaceae bacterium]
MAEARTDNYLTHTTGLRSWIFTLDHKRIGVMYLVSIMAALALGGFFAMMIRAELASPGAGVFDDVARLLNPFRSTNLEPADYYNQAFTLHGAVMIFLFIIPGIPAALGNFVLPIMLGAKDVAFPRLNLASYYLYAIGAIFFVLTLVLGGLDTGWTFYTPYSTETNTMVITATTGAFILGFSSIFTGLNFVATIHTLRPPGMTWFKMPLFVWSNYATSLIQVLGTPVLAVTIVLLACERVFH